MTMGQQVKNAHATAWAHLLLSGFLRPQFDKLLPALIFCSCRKNSQFKKQQNV